MKKLGRSVEIKHHTNWYTIGYHIEEPSIKKGKQLIKSTKKILDEFNAIYNSQSQVKNTRFNFSKNSKNRLRESLYKLNISESNDKKINSKDFSYYIEVLDNQFKDCSSGKISLNTVFTHKKIENPEETISSVFDLGCKFSEITKIKLAELKAKEEYLKSKTIIKKPLKKK